MRRFNPDRFFADVYTTIHYNFIGSRNYSVVFNIIIPNFNDTVTAIKFFASVWRIIVHYVTFTIVIKENRRVDTTKIKFNRAAPTLFWVFCFYNNISHPTGKGGYNHIKRIVMWIVGYAGRINAFAYTCIVWIKFFNIIQNTTKIGPVYQIL